MEVALQQDLSYLAAAYLGYTETLEDIFGTPDEPKKEKEASTTKDARGQPIVLTPQIFDLQEFGVPPHLRQRAKPKSN